MVRRSGPLRSERSTKLVSSSPRTHHRGRGSGPGIDAIELLMAGASAVEVGTATFYEPAASARILKELREWCQLHRISNITELIGAAHG